MILRSNGFIGIHPDRRTRRQDLVGGPLGERAQRLAASLPVTAHVEHQPAAHAGALLHRQPGQLLQRVERLTLRADQRLQPVADDRHDGAIVLDVEIDVAVVVDDVEQPLEVVGGDVALLDQQRARVRWLGASAPSSTASSSDDISGSAGVIVSLVRVGRNVGLCHCAGGPFRFS